MINPFPVQYDPDYFCDRENELTGLRENLINGLNTLVHSPRRLGKSALIRHFFHQLDGEKEYEEDHHQGEQKSSAEKEQEIHGFIGL